jgi:hypothetical protein
LLLRTCRPAERERGVRPFFLLCGGEKIDVMLLAFDWRLGNAAEGFREGQEEMCCVKLPRMMTGQTYKAELDDPTRIAYPNLDQAPGGEDEAEQIGGFNAKAKTKKGNRFGFGRHFSEDEQRVSTVRKVGLGRQQRIIYEGDSEALVE